MTITGADGEQYQISPAMLQQAQQAQLVAQGYQAGD